MRISVAAVLLLIAVGGGVIAFFVWAQDPMIEPPEVRDDRIEVTLFAADPDIRTPIGIAVDGEDRIFVLESHTHLEPDDYEGPEGDRVKIFEDTNGDGKPENVSVFAEGLDNAMNIAFSREGTLYVVSSQAVWALYDRDDDGVSEAREKVLEMVRPDGVYDHAGLMGITFAHDGWMYVSRGNTGGQHWEMVGSDGSDQTIGSGFGHRI